jgi:hypothetical protein
MLALKSIYCAFFFAIAIHPLIPSLFVSGPQSSPEAEVL